MTWTETISGRRVELLNPDPDSIDPSDIAHALARICRFAGMVESNGIYSVAQHSILVANNVPPEFRAAAILHDAAEAYTGDIPSPMKAAARSFGVPSTIDLIESKLLAAIYRRFGITAPTDDTIKQADRSALVTERRDLRENSGRDWSVDAEPFAERISPWPVLKAELELLREFSECGIV